MAIKDMQTLLEEGHIAGPLDGSELLLIEQGGFSKVLTVEALYQYLSGRCGCSGGDCVPSSIPMIGSGEMPQPPSDEDALTVSWRLDGGDVQTASWEPTSSVGPGLIYAEVLRQLVEQIGLNAIDQQDIYTGGGTFEWYFTQTELGGCDGTAVPAPAVLELLLTPDATFDAVSLLFGGAVDVQSCGSQNFMGT